MKGGGRMENNSISVALFTHKNTISGEICFEENDLSVLSIQGEESVNKRDFDKIFECLQDVDTKYLQAESWYSFTVIRERDGNNFYFDLIETELLINND